MTPASGSGGEDHVFLIDSEFATVRVSMDVRANGPRLLVSDLRNGNEIYLDAFALACLAGADPQTFVDLADPANTLWGAAEHRDATRAAAADSPTSPTQ